MGRPAGWVPQTVPRTPWGLLGTRGPIGPMGPVGLMKPIDPMEFLWAPWATCMESTGFWSRASHGTHWPHGVRWLMASGRIPNLSPGESRFFFYPMGNKNSREACNAYNGVRKEKQNLEDTQALIAGVLCTFLELSFSSCRSFFASALRLLSCLDTMPSVL